jgi:hypothetical protein
MSTQIYINPNTCKPEFTKIAAHAFGFSPDVLMSDVFYYGGTPTGVGGQLWSAHNYELSENETQLLDQGAFIPIPINLVNDDVITITGTAAFNNAKAWQQKGWIVNFVVGVFYLNCSEIGNLHIPYFTFVPITTFEFNNKGVACFSIDTTLTSNFDRHETKLVMVYNVYVECPDPLICDIPETTEPLVTVSHTMDIDRPCAVITSESNFIIRNCCEPLITELVNIVGLTVGSFHVDDEGNCWEVISASTDVTNFTRNFTDLYGSCTDCITANPCPQNLMIKSCCVTGQEYVTGSLPGLNVGDTFVDNNGLCWYVDAETGAPISEESITVVTEIIGDCTVCTDTNPCPDFWYVKSCCGQLQEIIATTTVLNFQDSFVDTNGICWNVDSPATLLPTNYNIVVDTVYPGPMGACTVCRTANPCPTEYFITVRACCDPDRIEVIAVPAAYMSFSEGSIFSDPYKVCWEVMSYSTTGVETYPIAWGTAIINTYPKCDLCINVKGKATCISIWEVRDCATNLVYTVSSNSSPAFMPTIGSFYNGFLVATPTRVCFEVLGYGYPQSGTFGQLIPSPEFGSCEECSISLNGLKTIEIQLCCGGPTIIATTILGFPYGTNGVYASTINGVIQCYTIIGISTGTPGPIIIDLFLNDGGTDCTACLIKYPC